MIKESLEISVIHWLRQPSHSFYTITIYIYINSLCNKSIHFDLFWYILTFFFLWSDWSLYNSNYPLLYFLTASLFPSSVLVSFLLWPGRRPVSFPVVVRLWSLVSFHCERRYYLPYPLANSLSACTIFLIFFIMLRASLLFIFASVFLSLVLVTAA